jgi:hypothetical protein
MVKVNYVLLICGSLADGSKIGTLPSLNQRRFRLHIIQRTSLQGSSSLISPLKLLSQRKLLFLSCLKY